MQYLFLNLALKLSINFVEFILEIFTGLLFYTQFCHMLKQPVLVAKMVLINILIGIWGMFCFVGGGLFWNRI